MTTTDARLPANGDFTETQWSLIRAAADPASPVSAAALETLCSKYWPPIYVYVRARGYAEHDAQDLTQEFFARIIRNNSFALADQKKGAFRGYLIGALRHFLAEAWHTAHRQKRIAPEILLSLNDAEARYSDIASPELTPETAYDHGWRLVLLEQGLKRLEQELQTEGKDQQFVLLKRYLTEPPKHGEYDRIASELGLSENGVAVLVFRLKRRFRELVRAELAQTVTSKSELDEELRELFGQPPKRH